MPPTSVVQTCRSMALALGWLLSAALPALSAAAQPTLDDGLMDEAIAYFGVLRGSEISPEDAAWLKAAWREEAALAPEVVAAQVDDLAVLYERHQRDADPLMLATGRTDLLKNTYCTAAQSSDPALDRLSTILAPADLVLAADCVLGLVITRFDVDGLVASHALLAAASGQAHDADGDRAEIMAAIDAGFASATAGEKAPIARGELRHAILTRFWDAIEGTPEQQAVVDALRGEAASELKAPARRLEELAASKLGEVDALARAGGARLTAGAVDLYREWLELIAGAPMSTRERAWLEGVIVDEFQGDPDGMLSQIGGVNTLLTNYRASSDAGEKAAMLNAWAANLHCHLGASGDPDEKRLAEVIFRHDPVTEVDCAAGRIRRASESVLAEAGGATLLEKDVALARRFAEVLLARPLSPEEQGVVREDSIRSFEDDLGAWTEEQAFYGSFLGEIDRHRTDVFLGMDERKKLFDPIYCQLEASDEPFREAYLAMFRRGGAILFEDCERQIVTTRNEMQAVTDLANFLALIDQAPPPSESELQTLRQSLVTEDMDNAESTVLALREWWSLLTLEEKAAAAEAMRADGISLTGDGAKLGRFVETVKLKVVAANARIQSCRMLGIVIQGQTAIYAASLSPYGATAGNPSGIPGEQLAGLVSATNAAAELCRGVGAG